MMDRLLVTIAILMRTLVSGTTCDSYQECYQDYICTSYVYCYGYQSCRDADITASVYIYARSMYSLYSAEVTTASAWVDGYMALYYGELTASSYLYASADYAIYYSDVSATYVYGYAYRSLYYSDILATYVYAYSTQTLMYADIEPKTTSLYVYFWGYQSGYVTDIVCTDGDYCYVYCKQDYACYDVNLYCYSGATCTYVNDCDESGSSYCIDHYETGPGVTDVDIRKIYEENKKRFPEEEPIPIDNPDEPDQPDTPVKSVPNEYGHYYLSFSNAQFALLCLLNVLLICATVGFCLFYTSGAAKKYTQKEDFN